MRRNPQVVLLVAHFEGYSLQPRTDRDVSSDAPFRPTNAGGSRQVYLVCIPGEPLYPILATCPLEESSLEAFPVTVGHKPPECQDNVVKASTADEDIAVGRSSTNTRGKILSHTPGGSIPVAAAPATEEPLPEAGFLLRWDVPARHRWSSTRDEVDLRIDEASDEPHYGGFEGFDDTGVRARNKPR